MTYLTNNFVNCMITLGFIFIHLFSNVISSRKLNVQYMSSFAAGVGISYAIVHLLPHLAYFQTVLIDEFGWDSGIFYSHGVYGIVLFGLVFSYVIYKIDERTFMVLEKKDITSAKNAFFLVGYRFSCDLQYYDRLYCDCQYAIRAFLHFDLLYRFWFALSHERLVALSPSWCPL